MGALVQPALNIGSLDACRASSSSWPVGTLTKPCRILWFFAGVPAQFSAAGLLERVAAGVPVHCTVPYNRHAGKVV